MSDNRRSWPILSANKIGQQKSVVCRAKKSVDFVDFVGVFRPFAAPSKCRPVRPAPPHPRRYATAQQT